MTLYKLTPEQFNAFNDRFGSSVDFGYEDDAGQHFIDSRLIAAIDNAPYVTETVNDASQALFGGSFESIAVRLGVPRIFALAKAEAREKHHHNINYKVEVQKLHPVRDFVKGELQKITWFAEPTHLTPVIRVEITYQRDPLNFAVSRTTKRIWINEDGTDNAEPKETTKVYSGLQKIEEGIRRRGNLVKNLKYQVMQLLFSVLTDKAPEEVIQIGQQFLKDHQLAFVAFVEESHPAVIEDIQNATDVWLDSTPDAIGVTLRNYLIEEFSI